MRLSTRPSPSVKSWKSFGLALGMHSLLIALLVIGVNWKRQEQAPANVSAQLWTDLPVAAVPAAPPAPRPEPKPEPRPEPKPEPKQVEKAKPDLVVKAEPPRKPIEKKSEPKKEAPKDEKASKEPASNDEQRRKELDRLVAAAQAGAPAASISASPTAGAGGAKADADYGAKLRSLLKSNTVFASAQDIEGNPSVVFAVRLRPDCSIASVKLQKSSGLAAWDTAAERAIKRSDPFPVLKDGNCPRDELTITQRLKD